jgi:hypothetical protein
MATTTTRLDGQGMSFPNVKYLKKYSVLFNFFYKLIHERVLYSEANLYSLLNHILALNFKVAFFFVKNKYWRDLMSMTSTIELVRHKNSKAYPHFQN